MAIATRILPPWLVFLLFSSAAPAPAGEITDDSVSRAIDAYHAKREALSTGGATLKAEDYDRLLEGALDGLPIEEMTPRQIAMVAREGLLGSRSRRHEAIDRLDAFVEDEGEAGAVTAILRLSLLGGRSGPRTPNPKQQGELLRAALNHPAMPAALKSGAACDLFDAVGSLGSPAVWKECAEQILALEKALDAGVAPECARGVGEISGVLAEIAPDAAAKTRLRGKLVALGRSALAKAESDPGLFGEATTKHLLRTLARLDGAAARGELLGHAAPPIAFAWASRDGLKSLADLRGKVVVLDFWATWCGPCVASIPDVRELKKRYESFPVEILGVTSVQGTHVDPDEGAIDTKGDPAKEFALMRDYMKKKDITWTIAFSAGDVFDPEYGVEGIPHVAIVDAKGIVRHTNLHPSSPLAEKASLIDALLREAGLPAPAPAPIGD